jgi:hypothetical protein
MIRSVNVVGRINPGSFPGCEQLSLSHHARLSFSNVRSFMCTMAGKFGVKGNIIFAVHMWGQYTHELLTSLGLALSN